MAYRSRLVHRAHHADKVSGQQGGPDRPQVPVGGEGVRRRARRGSQRFDCSVAVSKYLARAALKKTGPGGWLPHDRPPTVRPGHHPRQPPPRLPGQPGHPI